MKIKDLEKATKVLDQIKILDSEIIEIDKLALLIADGSNVITIELKVQTLDEAKKEVLDSDGSLIDHNRTRSHEFFGGILGHYRSICEPIKPPAPLHLLRKELNESSALHILGLLLREKQFIRISLIEKIKKLGFKI